MKHGIKWLLATGVFISALIIALSAGRSDHPAVQMELAGQPQVAPATSSCPKARRGVWVGGKPDGREVALSFDDGPSDETPAILRTLRRHHAHATFFLIGQEIPGREGILRRAIRDGDELGNHSTTHTSLPSHDDISQTSRLIHDATGQRPCLFRPPDGDTSPALLHDVHKQGMTTIAWDVDTSDWEDQSPTDIRERALATVHPGSIILLHDGGGNRVGTAHAVSAIVDGLHARHYRVVTVSHLFPDPRQ